MNKIKLAFLVIMVSALFGLTRKGSADMSPDSLAGGGLSYRVCIGSCQVFVGGGALYRVDFPTANTPGSDYVVAFDTKSIAGISLTAFQANNSTQASGFVNNFQVTPQYVLYSTGANSTIAASAFRDYSPYGIYLQNGLFVFSNTGANTFGVLYKK